MEYFAHRVGFLSCQYKSFSPCLKALCELFPHAPIPINWLSSSLLRFSVRTLRKM